MKHPVLGVLSILSISVYAATLPGHVDDAPLLVKRQVYPEDPPADSMNQPPESVDEPSNSIPFNWDIAPLSISPSTSQLLDSMEELVDLGLFDWDITPSSEDQFTPDSHGNPGSDTDSSSEKQGGASQTSNRPGPSYDTPRPSFEAPSSSDMYSPFDYQPAKRQKVSHSYGSGTVSKKPCVGRCIKDSIYVQSDGKNLGADQAPARKCKGCEAGEEGGKLFLEASDKRMQLLELEKEIKDCKEYIFELEEEKKEELDATEFTNLQKAIDASIIDYKSKIEVAKKLKEEIQEIMKKAGEFYSAQYTSSLGLAKP
ncbi:hypothetical protein BASA83_002191 [Batrachochytrium salamandrivorans]|nr:hypothetical protein BASA83_002191 [Batrachochytrium salamandrivorans]